MKVTKCTAAQAVNTEKKARRTASARLLTETMCYLITVTAMVQRSSMVIA